MASAGREFHALLLLSESLSISDLLKAQGQDLFGSRLSEAQDYRQSKTNEPNCSVDDPGGYRINLKVHRFS
jgi:hypothetical protein